MTVTWTVLHGKDQVNNTASDRPTGRGLAPAAHGVAHTFSMWTEPEVGQRPLPTQLPSLTWHTSVLPPFELLGGGGEAQLTGFKMEEKSYPLPPTL